MRHGLGRFETVSSESTREDIAVWVYLVPPSESPPKYGHLYSEPFRLDYLGGRRRLRRLSLEHPKSDGLGD